MERIDPLHPEVVRALQGMSGMERMRLAHEMWETVRAQLTAYVSHRHPDWSSQQIDREVAARLLGDSAGAPSLRR